MSATIAHIIGDIMQASKEALAKEREEVLSHQENEEERENIRKVWALSKMKTAYTCGCDIYHSMKGNPSEQLSEYMEMYRGMRAAGLLNEWQMENLQLLERVAEADRELASQVTYLFQGRDSCCRTWQKMRSDKVSDTDKIIFVTAMKLPTREAKRVLKKEIFLRDVPMLLDHLEVELVKALINALF